MGLALYVQKYSVDAWSTYDHRQSLCDIIARELSEILLHLDPFIPSVELSSTLTITLAVGPDARQNSRKPLRETPGQTISGRSRPPDQTDRPISTNGSNGKYGRYIAGNGGRNGRYASTHLTHSCLQGGSNQSFARHTRPGEIHPRQLPASSGIGHLRESFPLLVTLGKRNHVRSVS